ncbi:MAG: DEAD/DEAH box helicase [Thermoguttaceae bacterium]|jgi:SNF2 family DNA or RNA helicase
MTNGPAVHHWFPPPAPDAREVDLRLPATPQATGWNEVLARPLGIEVSTIAVEVPPPRVVSISIHRPALVVRSFRFPEPVEETAVAAAPSHPSHPCQRGASPAAKLPSHPSSATRIRPPQDVIKLEDRLHYLLQPPLETLLLGGSLVMPLRPFPFQFDGIAFLYPRHAAILADEMGLGKTMQAITTIRLLMLRREIATVLLVCPKPLVTNWQREFHLWAPELPVLVVEGEQARRAWQWRLPDVPVRIANYEMVVRDREVVERGGSDGHRVRFDLVVLDESQRIKNRAGATSEVVRGIARRRSWALTGTPVENTAEDLVGIFDFLAPGFLSPEMKPRKMGRTVRDYVLRRTKEQVLTEMPPKLFRDADLELTPAQREAYRLAEEEGVVRLTEMGAAAKIQHVFELVLRLKQICNFDPASGESSKLERLEADLEETATSGRKAIVFSQWVATVRRLADALGRFGPLEYHGQVPSARRDGVVRQFRDDPGRRVLLMTYGAGGVGLNLQFASYVFLFDRWWNPAVEDQAVNRAHRIGTSGPVTVSRFLVLDTIEERIDRILQEKRALFDAIFSGATGPQRLGLTEQELFGLFRLAPHRAATGNQCAA